MIMTKSCKKLEAQEYCAIGTRVVHKEPDIKEVFLHDFITFKLIPNKFFYKKIL